MTFTTSDWITITAAIGQIAATVGAVVWQVKKTLPTPIPLDTKPTALKIFHRIQFIRTYLPSLLSIAFGIVGLVSIFLSFSVVDKLFIASAIFFSLLCTIHFLAVLFFKFMLTYSDFLVDQVFAIVEHEKELTLQSSGRSNENEQ